jgi:hypothetical protein
MENKKIATNRTPVKARGSMSSHAILNSVNVDAHISATDNSAKSISSGGGLLPHRDRDRVMLASTRSGAPYFLVTLRSGRTSAIRQRISAAA